jgi:Asp-tRNA(Asn)/Glu-tRNA(Gln) amidotransferase B subunit
MPYLVTIGLEVNARVNARTKMFCACRTSFGGPGALQLVPCTNGCDVFGNTFDLVWKIE